MAMVSFMSAKGMSLQREGGFFVILQSSLAPTRTCLRPPIIPPSFLMFYLGVKYNIFFWDKHMEN